MKALKKILLFLCVLVFSNSFSQDYPQFSQHVGLQGIINPAYNGSREAYSALLVSRTYWANAINTHGFNAHAPLPIRGLGAGVVVMQDNSGLYSNLYVSGALSYAIHLSYDVKLALGLQGGVVREQVDNAYNNSGGGADQTMNDNFGQTNNRPSAGLGFYLYSPRYFVGLSMPEVLVNGTDFTGTFYDDIPLLLYGGYVFEVSQDVRLKPTLFSKFSTSSPLMVEAGISAYYLDLFKLGVATRTYPFSTLVFNAEIQIIEDLFVGYSYDYSLSATSGIKSGAHEISLRFDMSAKRLFTRPSGSMRYF